MFERYWISRRGSFENFPIILIVEKLYWSVLQRETFLSRFKSFLESFHNLLVVSELFSKFALIGFLSETKCKQELEKFPSLMFIEKLCKLAQT